MQKRRNKMEIIIKAPATLPFSKTVVDKTKAGEMGEVPVLLKKRTGTNVFDAFVEDMDEDHKFGFVFSVDGSNDADNIAAAVSGKPDIRIVSVTGKLIKCDLKNSAPAVKTEAGEESKELSDLWDKKIAEGIVTAEDRETITWLFNNHKIPTFFRIKVVESYKVFLDGDGKRIKPLKPGHLYVNADPLHKRNEYDGSLFFEGIISMLNHQPTVFEGDKSTGKSVMAKTLAYVFQMPYWEDTYSDDMMHNDPLAYQSFDDTPFKYMNKEGAEASMLWHSDPDKFANYYDEAAVYEFWKAKAMAPQLATVLGEMGKWAVYGGLYVANEANLARINVRESLFNPTCEDNNPHITILGYGLVFLNPDCTLIATQNRDYAGTNGSNDAVDSRFGKIIFPYADQIFDQVKSSVESDCGKGCLTDVYYKTVDNLWKYFLGQVHDGVRENGILSIRSFIKALKDVAFGGGYVSLHSRLVIYLQSMAHSDEEYRMIIDDVHRIVGDL